MTICGGALKRRLKEGQLVVCVQANAFRSTALVEVFHEVGYDVLNIDLEHTALTIEKVADHIRVARTLNMPCMVRVASPDYDNLNRVLDQGADGVYIPRIRSAAEVERVVELIHYPPKGIRGVAGYGCPVAKYRGWSSLSEHLQTVNSNLVLGIQIETREALENLEEILAVPGIDAAVIGADDLSTALGIPGETSNKIFIDAVERVIEVCRKNRIVPGIPCATPEAASEWITRGMRMLWYGLDIGLVWEAASRRLNGLRETLSSVGLEGIWIR